MSKRRFRNQPVLIGTVTGKNFKGEVGRNGLHELKVRANGNNIKVAPLWENENKDTNKFLNGLEEGQTVKIGGSLNQRFWDGNAFIEVQPYGTGSINPTTEAESSVAAVEGDVFKFDANEVKYTEDGLPYGSLKMIVFDQYNRETRKSDLTPAQVLANEIKRQIEWTKENTDKDTKNYDDLITTLEADDSVATVHHIYNELIENVPNLRFYQIALFDLTFEGKVGERLINEVNEKDNISVGVRIVNRQETDEFGYATDFKTELQLAKLRSINEKAKVEEVSTSGGW